MKKGLKLLLVYFMILLGGTLAGTLFYSLYLNVLNFVAGSNSNFFYSDYLIQAVFICFESMCVLICPIICYYRARHPYGFLQTLFYILVCLITWAVLFPVVNKIHNAVNNRHESSIKISSLSKDIFRKNENHVYYLLEDFDAEEGSYAEAASVLIDTSEDGEMKLTTVQNSESFELYKTAVPFREILIKDSLKFAHKRSIIDLNLIIRRCEIALQKGWTFFLGFLTLGFLLCSLYGVTNLYNWKLISVAMILLETMLALVLNTIYFYPMCDALIYKLTSNKFFYFLGRYIDEPLLCLINIVIGLGFIVAGIIHYCLKKRKKA